MLDTVDSLLKTCESLIARARTVIENWESGDLAAAVTDLGRTASAAQEVVSQIRQVTSLPLQPQGSSAECFKTRVGAIPQYCAVFKLTGTSRQMREQGLILGQTVRFFTTSDLAWYRTKNHPSLADGSIHHFSIAPSRLRFVGYEPVKEFPWDERRRLTKQTPEATR